jgi:hypothetical protein
LRQYTPEAKRRAIAKAFRSAARKRRIRTPSGAIWYEDPSPTQRIADALELLNRVAEGRTWKAKNGNGALTAEDIDFFAKREMEARWLLGEAHKAINDGTKRGPRSAIVQDIRSVLKEICYVQTHKYGEITRLTAELRKHPALKTRRTAVNADAVKRALGRKH